MKKIYILCTLGPSTINKKFLDFLRKYNNILVVRLNLSHLTIDNLKKNINFIQKYSKIPICIDTEGAQIRTKVKKKLFLKKSAKGKIFKSNDRTLSLYPQNVFDKLRLGDVMELGFDNLKIILTAKKKDYFIFKVLTSGVLENNKGVHLENRKIKLDPLTDKDYEAIKLAKEYNIKNFALSFVHHPRDLDLFNNLLPNCNKIFKIETKSSIKNLDLILKKGKFFLIDRGDLSKEILLKNIPYYQRIIQKKCKKYKKNIFVATNLLESMLENPTPNRGEVNDIYNCLEMGADGLVLAGETAIGKYPEETINFLDQMIKVYKKKTYELL